MTNQETNSQTEQVLTESKAELIPENLCQGYLVDPLTKLHLCTACNYHRYRNESKPWLK